MKTVKITDLCEIDPDEIVAMIESWDANGNVSTCIVLRNGWYKSVPMTISSIREKIGGSKSARLLESEDK